MEIPFNTPLRLYEQQRKATEAAVQSVLNSGHYLLGPELKKLEEKLQNHLSTSHVLGCNSGTDALILSLRALGIGAGDEVIVPSHTAVPTVAAICAIDAIPVFSDIDRDTWLIDAKHIQPLIGKKTKAIIPVHLYGNMVDMPSILSLGIPIIEDVAQAFGAKQKNKYAGTFGALGAYSFYPTKNLGALGDAGAVSTNQAELAERVRELRFYGQKDRYLALTPKGINSRLDEIQAAILSVRMEKVSGWIEERAKIYAQYNAAFTALPIQLQKVTKDTMPAWHLAVIALEDKDTRDKLQQHLEKNKIGTVIHYPNPNHCQPAFKKYSKNPLPETEMLANRILSLPLYPGLAEAEIDFICKIVTNFFK